MCKIWIKVTNNAAPQLLCQSSSVVSFIFNLRNVNKPPSAQVMQKQSGSKQCHNKHLTTEQILENNIQINSQNKYDTKQLTSINPFSWAALFYSTLEFTRANFPLMHRERAGADALYLSLSARHECSGQSEFTPDRMCDKHGTSNFFFSRLWWSAALAQGLWNPGATTDQIRTVRAEVMMLLIHTHS